MKKAFLLVVFATIGVYAPNTYAGVDLNDMYALTGQRKPLGEVPSLTRSGMFGPVPSITRSGMLGPVPSLTRSGMFGPTPNLVRPGMLGEVPSYRELFAGRSLSTRSRSTSQPLGPVPSITKKGMFGPVPVIRGGRYVWKD